MEMSQRTSGTMQYMARSAKSASGEFSRDWALNPAQARIGKARPTPTASKILRTIPRNANMKAARGSPLLIVSRSTTSAMMEGPRIGAAPSASP